MVTMDSLVGYLDMAVDSHKAGAPKEAGRLRGGYCDDGVGALHLSERPTGTSGRLQYTEASAVTSILIRVPIPRPWWSI